MAFAFISAVFRNFIQPFDLVSVQRPKKKPWRY